MTRCHAFASAFALLAFTATPAVAQPVETAPAAEVALPSAESAPSVGVLPGPTPPPPAIPDPDVAALRERARQHLERGEYEDARRAASASVALAPTDATAQQLVGRARLALGEIDGAVQALAEAVRLGADDAANQRLLGDALRVRGDRARAVRAYERAIEIDPSDTRARDGLRFAMTLEVPRPAETRDATGRELAETARRPSPWGLNGAGATIGAGAGFVLALVTADSIACEGSCDDFTGAVLVGSLLVGGGLVTGGWIGQRIATPIETGSEPGVIIAGGLLAITGLVVGSAALDAAKNGRGYARGMATDADILMGAGLATAGTGIALAVTRGGADDDSDERPAIVVTPTVTPGVTGLTIGGRM